MRKIAIMFACVLYLIFPWDIIPDFIFGPGQLDDLAALAVTFKTLLSKRGNSVT